MTEHRKIDLFLTHLIMLAVGAALAIMVML